MRLRSVVAVAAGGEDLELALASPADALLLTLADSRFPAAALRERAAAALPRVRAAGKRALVTVNHPRTRLLRDDVAALPLDMLDAVLLPHAVEPQDIRDLAVVLREFELAGGVEPGVVAVFPVIDTARGLLRAGELMAAAPRAAGLVFHTAAYARDIGARDEESGERLAFARGAVIAAARAHEGQPLVRGSELELAHMARHGFAGAVLASTAQALAANLAFEVSSARIEHARAEADVYAAARAEAHWVGRIGEQVVDAHTARKARRLLE